jgi:hypothetical protein
VGYKPHCVIVVCVCEMYIYIYIYCVSCEVRTEFIHVMNKKVDLLCGLVVRVPGYRPKGPGSIPEATRFSEK